MNLKTLIISILFCVLGTGSLSAQEYVVKSFEIRQGDIDARVNSRVGSNGRKCALLKVYVQDGIHHANGSVVGDIVTRGMEKLIYMAHDSKQVELVFDNHFPLHIRFDDYEVPSLTEQIVYVIKLVEDNTDIPQQSDVYNSVNLRQPAADNPPKPEVSSTNTPQPTVTANPLPTPHTSNIINGHECVDLGLPSGLRWATCNVGAAKPGDNGDYFAWGTTATETEGRIRNGNDASWDIYANSVITQITPGSGHDAARENWGATWRMPTEVEFDELITRCDWKWTKQDGNKGYLVTGPNGKSIFLPAGGYRDYGITFKKGKAGCYWSSTKAPVSDSARYLYFDNNFHGAITAVRTNALGIRPVTE